MKLVVEDILEYDIEGLVEEKLSPPPYTTSGIVEELTAEVSNLKRIVAKLADVLLSNNQITIKDLFSLLYIDSEYFIVDLHEKDPEKYNLWDYEEEWKFEVKK